MIWPKAELLGEVNLIKQKLKNNFKEIKKMKVRPSVKPICDKCKVIKREGKVMVIFSKSKKHKQVQG